MASGLLLVSAQKNGSPRLLHMGDGKFEDKPSARDVCHWQRTGLRRGRLRTMMANGFRHLHGRWRSLVSQRRGRGKFTDVTKAVNIRSEKGCSLVTFVDFDHDGPRSLLSAKPALGRTTSCGATMAQPPLPMFPPKLRWQRSNWTGVSLPISITIARLILVLAGGAMVRRFC